MHSSLNFHKLNAKHICGASTETEKLHVTSPREAPPPPLQPRPPLRATLPRLLRAWVSFTCFCPQCNWTPTRCLGDSTRLGHIYSHCCVSIVSPCVDTQFVYPACLLRGFYKEYFSGSRLCLRRNTWGSGVVGQKWALKSVIGSPLLSVWFR